MLGFIKKDLLLVKANLRSLLVVFVMFVILSFQGSFDLNFIIPFMAVMLFISTFSYDDFNKWNTYACSLPAGRRNVVLGKYLASFILALLSSLVGVVLSILLGITKNNLDMMSILTNLAGTMCGVILIIALLYPLIFKFGSEKGRIFMFVVVFLIFAVGGLLANFVDMNGFLNLVRYIDTYWYVLVPILGILFVGGSYLLSKRIYLKKEF